MILRFKNHKGRINLLWLLRMGVHKRQTQHMELKNRFLFQKRYVKTFLFIVAAKKFAAELIRIIPQQRDADAAWQRLY